MQKRVRYHIQCLRSSIHHISTAASMNMDINKSGTYIATFRIDDLASVRHCFFAGYRYDLFVKKYYFICQNFLVMDYCSVDDRLHKRHYSHLNSIKRSF